LPKYFNPSLEYKVSTREKRPENRKKRTSDVKESKGNKCIKVSREEDASFASYETALLDHDYCLPDNDKATQTDLSFDDLHNLSS